MTVKFRQLTFAFIVALALFAVAAAQPPAPVYAETRDFKAKVFELKYRDPQELYGIIKVLSSGFKGAEVTYSSAYKTIAVRDFPENLATIEEAIKRLDVPSARSEPSVELTIYVLLTNTGKPSEALPTDLKDVMTQLQKTLLFKDYQLLTTAVQRAKARGRSGGWALNGKGNAGWKELNQDGGTFSSGLVDYDYRAQSVEAITTTSGATTILLTDFVFTFGRANVQSNVELRDGEKLVVGTAGIGDNHGNKAMILVLTAKIMK